MSAEFVAHMEDVLDLYAEPYNPQRPVVCFDETSTQLLAETRPPMPLRPGRPMRQDYEYRREGTRNLFLACQPLAGWCHVAVTQRRTMQDFAHQMRWLVDAAYPEVPVVRLVLDNLNTHRMASLYETFPAAEARRIAQRLEFHYTPKHGSWLNMAEIEFSVLSRCCLKQRVPDEPGSALAATLLLSSETAYPRVCGVCTIEGIMEIFGIGRSPRLRGGSLAGNCYYCGICCRHLLHCPVDLVPEFPYGSAGSLGPFGTPSYPYYLRGEACLHISLWSSQAGPSSGDGVVMPARGRQGGVSARSSPIPPG